MRQFYTVGSSEGLAGIYGFDEAIVAYAAAPDDMNIFPLGRLRLPNLVKSLLSTIGVFVPLALALALALALSHSLHGLSPRPTHRMT